MIQNLIAWTVFGLIAGALARLLRPGPDRMGCLGTIVLGVAGSLLGGGIAYLLRLGTTPFQPGGLILSVIGAILLLVMGAFAPRRRA